MWWRAGIFLQKLFSSMTLRESQVLDPIFLLIGLDISLDKFLPCLMTEATAMDSAVFAHAFCRMVKVGASAPSLLIPLD